MANTLISDRAAAGTTAYDLVMRRNFRSMPVFSTPMITKVMPTQQTHRGSTVKFWFTDDLAPATTPLTENVDVTPQSVGDRSVDVTIAQYGATVGYTDAVVGTDMLEVNMDAAIAAANQAVDSYEILARTALSGGTNVAYGGDATATAELVAADTLDLQIILKGVADMRAANVPTIAGDKYLAIVHPHVSLDLREQTGDSAWLTSRNEQDLTSINTGFIGSIGGALFHETSRAEIVADAGAVNVDSYNSFLLGPEALAMAYASKVSGAQPSSVVAPVVDKLQRFAAIGWKWFGGFDSLRQESCLRIETASSIGSNT